MITIGIPLQVRRRNFLLIRRFEIYFSLLIFLSPLKVQTSRMVLFFSLSTNLRMTVGCEKGKKFLCDIVMLLWEKNVTINTSHLKNQKHGHKLPIQIYKYCYWWVVFLAIYMDTNSLRFFATCCDQPFIVFHNSWKLNNICIQFRFMPSSRKECLWLPTFVYSI